MGSSRLASAGRAVPLVLYRVEVYSYDMLQYTIHYKSNNNVIYSCKYHVVWCPKYLRAVLVNGVDVRLKAIIHGVCTESHAEILELEVMQDHVHLLVEVDPQYGVPRGSYAKNIPGLSLGYQRSGRTPTLSRLLAVRL